MVGHFSLFTALLIDNIQGVGNVSVFAVSFVRHTFQWPPRLKPFKVHTTNGQAITISSAHDHYRMAIHNSQIQQGPKAQGHYQNSQASQRHTAESMSHIRLLTSRSTPSMANISRHLEKVALTIHTTAVQFGSITFSFPIDFPKQVTVKKWAHGSPTPSTTHPMARFRRIEVGLLQVPGMSESGMAK